MRVKVLKESGRANHTYYHFTNVNGLIGILKDNIMTSHKQTRHILKGKNSVSFTRDKNFGSRSSDISLCRITVDGEKLAQKYKITPYEWGNDPDINFTARENQESESEEAIIGDVENIKDYIIAIDIVDKVYNNDDSVIAKDREIKDYLTPRQYVEYKLKDGKIVGLDVVSKKLKHGIYSYSKFVKFVESNGFKLGKFKISEDAYTSNPFKKRYNIDENNSNIKDYSLYFITAKEDNVDFTYMVLALSDKLAIKRAKESANKELRLKFGNLDLNSIKILPISEFTLLKDFNLKNNQSNNKINSFYQFIRNNTSRLNKLKSMKIIYNNNIYDFKKIYKIDKKNKSVILKV